MAKKKFRKRSFRNAAPRAPRVAKPEDETPLHRLAMTAAGAGGTALAGSFLVHEGWAPKTISTALAAVGAGLAWKGDTDTVRNIGTGVMSAAGGQLALMLIDDRNKQQAADTTNNQTAQAGPKRQAGELPAGSLENAFERAKARLALSTGAEEYAA
jgi:hypothetical protein